MLDSALGPLTAAWCAVLGAAVGSFLNVVIARVAAGESLVRPGSRCPTCHTHIRWYDNVPLISWLVLRARCRACGARISARYPLVESLGAAAALLAFARHGLSTAAAAEFVFASALIALALIDLDTWLLPHAITWPLLVLGIVANALAIGPARTPWPSLYGAGLGFAAFALLAFVGEKVFRREALGFGDVFLVGALGAWLGHKALLPVTLLASLQGAVVGLVLIALGKGEPGPEKARPEVPSRDALPANHQARLAAGDPVESGAAPVPDPFTPESPVQETKHQQIEDEWVPPRHAVPFGPFLAAAALEWLYLGDLLARTVPVLGVFR